MKAHRPDLCVGRENERSAVDKEAHGLQVRKLGGCEAQKAGDLIHYGTGRRFISVEGI